MCHHYTTLISHRSHIIVQQVTITIQCHHVWTGAEGKKRYSSNPALAGGGWSAPHSSCFTPRKNPVPIVQEKGWASGLVWMSWNSYCYKFTLPLSATAIIRTHRNLNLPFCIWATFLAISRIICILHFSALDKSRHSDARYGLLSLSFPVSLTWAALHRAKVVLKPV